MSLESLMCQFFRGRHDQIAVGNDDNTFAPFHCPAGIDPRWIAERHLAGVRCLGFYLMTPESNVYCTALDFDNKPERPDPLWKAKTEAVYLELMRAEIVPLVEISQSGNAAHVWLFFDAPTEAWFARAWWKALAAKLDVQINEIYPRQDRLAGKGIGNLIRYPLWNESRFVDVEADWSTIDPLSAMESIRPVSKAGLSLLAWELGLGELSPPPEITPVADGSKLPVRVSRMLDAKHSLLARRWNGDTNGLGDSSKSGLSMSITVELIRRYVPTQEVEAALRFWCLHNDAAVKGNRDDWVSHTVGKAYDFVVSRQEKKSIATTTFEGACYMYIDKIASGEEWHIPSSVQALDDSIDGVALGEVCVIAARPSHGKSAFAFHWLDHAASLGFPCLIISEEMSAIQIGKRRLSSITKLDATHWSAETQDYLKRDVVEFYKGRAPVHIVENCNTIERAEEVIDQFCKIHGVKVVAIDYLQLLRSKQEKRYDAVTEVSLRIKQATGRNECATLALCQLNREIEKRGKERQPSLADLRESGQIEQDADIIMFVQWPKMYGEEVPADEYRIYVGKRRNGPIRKHKVLASFDADTQTFGSYNRGYRVE